MVIMVLLVLAFSVCAGVGFVASLLALSRSRELQRRLLRYEDELDEVRGQLRRLAAPSVPPPTPEAIREPVAPPPVQVPARMAEPHEAAPELMPSEEPVPAAPAADAAYVQPSTGDTARRLAAFDWESLVGVKLFSWIAGVALALAAVFFLRYSIQSGWLQPPVQMAIGLFVGIALLAVCEMRFAGNYRVTANAMDAAGIVILFATFFAAFGLWHLVGVVPAFTGLALVTAIAVVLSIRRDSLFIAGLGLIGGFLTPALLSTGQDNPLGLFGYLFFLNAGLALVAVRKRWPWLTSASVLLTTIYQWGWVAAYMRPDRIPLAASIFVAFPVLSVAAMALGRRQGESNDNRVFSRTTDLSAVLPLLFALYMVTSPGFGEYAAFVLGFLFCVCAGLLALAIARRQPLLHVIGAASAFLVFETYILNSYDPGAWPAILGWLVLFVVFFLAAEWIAARWNQPFNPTGQAATAAAPALLLALPLIAGAEPATREPWLLFGTGFVLAAAIAFVARQRRRQWLHTLSTGAVSFLLISWLAVHQRPELAIALAFAWAALSVAWLFYIRARGDSDEYPELVPAAAIALGTGELVAAFAGAVPDASVAVLAVAHIVFLSAILWFATARRRYGVAVQALVPAALAIMVWIGAHPSPAPWKEELLLVFGIYAVFLAYPLVVGRRAVAVDDPWIAAVAASGLFFLTARHSLMNGGFEPVIGLLPLAQAGLMGLLLRRLLRLQPAGQRTIGRLALVAGAGLAFVTVAVPLQLDKQWITIGWALEAAALAWLYVRLPHRGLLAACIGLLAIVFVRLTLNPDLIAYHARGPRIVNWYLYTYLVPALSFFAAGTLLRTTDDRLSLKSTAVPRGGSLAKAGGIVLLFALLNVEIADYFSVGPFLTFQFSATLAQDLTYTLAWALFGVSLLVAGILMRSRPARIASLALLVATILKGFLHDLARLGGLYRVFSFVGLAVCLAIVAVVLQKFVLQRSDEAEPVER